jgi:hypothetical protein
VYQHGALEGSQHVRIGRRHLATAAVPCRSPIGTALALILLLIALLAGVPARAQMPWRIGAPEVVWRHERDTQYDNLITLAVHPEGGVIVAAANAAYGRTTFLRISPSGSKLWERTIVERGPGTGPHVTFLRREQGVDTIIALPGAVAALEPSGAVRWVRSAAEMGFDGVRGVAAGNSQVGASARDWIVVVGQGIGEHNEWIAMAAGLSSDGAPEWLAIVPQPTTAVQSQLGGRALDLASGIALPLRVRDDGGAEILAGCDPFEYWDYRFEDPPAVPCSARSPTSLVTIDGNGRATSIIEAGTTRWRARFDGRDLQAAAWLDAPPDPPVRNTPWDTDEFPRRLPSVWWFGASTPRLVQFLRRWIYPRPAPYPRLAPFVASSRSPSVAAFPAADVVVDGEVAYLVLAPAQYYGPRRIILLAVRRSGIDILAAMRARPLLDRVRYAPRESALYALRGNDIVRMPIVRSR